MFGRKERNGMQETAALSANKIAASKGPHYRFYLGRAEIGAACSKLPKKGAHYFSFKLDDP